MIPENELDLLQVRNETFVQQLEFHPELPSTNTLALEIAASGEASGQALQTPLLVVAERQSAGRGRSTNRWWSGPGTLTFTLLVDLPMLRPEQIGPMSLTVGLAVCQTLEQFAPAADLALKWPNDVFLQDKKVCGILIERPPGDEPQLAIGIGINVNTSREEIPTELRDSATSLQAELGEPQEQTRVLIEVLRNLEQRMDDHVHRRADLLDQWRAYCMLTGREICVEMHGQRTCGRCHGVDADGALLVADADGKIQRCIAGSVTLA